MRSARLERLEQLSRLMKLGHFHGRILTNVTNAFFRLHEITFHALENFLSIDGFTVALAFPVP